MIYMGCFGACIKWGCWVRCHQFKGTDSGRSGYRYDISEHSPLKMGCHSRIKRRKICNPASLQFTKVGD